MDSENFILSRSALLDRLRGRRATRLSSYPFRMLDEYGMKMPAWARLALSFVTRGGILGRFLEVGIPLAAPFLLRRHMPFAERLLQRIFSTKS